MPDDELPVEPVPGGGAGPGAAEGSAEPEAPTVDPLDLARRVADAYRDNVAPAARAPRRRTGPGSTPPRRTSREDPTTVSAVLGDMVRERGWDERLAAQRVFTDWASIVGAEVAQHSRVEAYADAVVHVRTSSTAWATQLKLLAPRLVAKLNEAMGDGSVVRVEVRGPQAPSWVKGRRTIRGARGPRDTYG